MMHRHKWVNCIDHPIQIEIDGQLYLAGYEYFKVCLWCGRRRKFFNRVRTFVVYGPEGFRRNRLQ